MKVSIHDLNGISCFMAIEYPILVDTIFFFSSFLQLEIMIWMLRMRKYLHNPGYTCLEIIQSLISFHIAILHGQQFVEVA